MNKREILKIEDEIELNVLRSQMLLGLLEWDITTGVAQGERLNDMRKKGQFARVEPKGKEAGIYVDTQTLPHSLLGFALDHELAHLLINPNPSFTGEGMEDIQATHIAYAMKELKEHPNRYKLDRANREQIVEKAMKLTRLDENDWRINIFESRNVGTAYAYSTYYRDFGHLGGLGARNIEMAINTWGCRDAHLEEKDVILREMWRVVLNPYGRPSDSLGNDKKLERIMGAMKGLGW